MRFVSCPVESGEVAVQQRAINRGTGLYHDLPADWRRNPSNHTPSAPPGHSRLRTATGIRSRGVTYRADCSRGLPERTGEGVSAPGRTALATAAMVTYPSHRSKFAPTPV